MVELIVAEQNKNMILLFGMTKDTKSHGDL
jgi:hypothetical protein